MTPYLTDGFGRIYAVAEEACRASKARLSKLKLTPEEKQLLASSPNEGSALITKLNFIMEDRKKWAAQPKWQQTTKQFFVRFCRVVDRTSDLVQALLPQSPEYTITFGVLLLLFKACCSCTMSFLFDIRI